jgi:hypothetical protein
MVVVTVLIIFEVSELRGELAFKRFYHFKQVARKLNDPDSLSNAVEQASSEAHLAMTFARENPTALWDITGSHLRWSAREELEPLLRLRLAETALESAELCVRAAPSDYLSWLYLARAQAVLGLPAQARASFDRARKLAPPGKTLRLFSSAARPPERFALHVVYFESERRHAG